MLTIQHRYYEHLRQSNADSERSTDVLPVKRTSWIKTNPIDQLDDEELMQQIKRIERENDNTRRENLLFSRYLRRMNTSNIVETYDEYEDENDVTIIGTFNQASRQTKSSDATRRISLKKRSSNTTRSSPVWNKLSYSPRGHIYAPYISRLEQERFFIASYEVEQTRLERERMETNAKLTIDKLGISSQMAESDESAQETLNRQLEQTIDKYRVDIGEEKYDNSCLTFPAERVLSYIKKQIKSRISASGLLRFNSARLYTRILEINGKIHSLADLDGKMDEIDITLIHTKKIANADMYKTVDRKYKIEKSSLYPLFRHLQEWKKVLNEQESAINDMKRKCEILQHLSERTTIEINDVKHEYEFLLKENNILKNRIDDIKEVPTITNYAHVIEETKILQHGIDIWAKRTNIAETFLSQLQRQKKPPRILPPLKTTIAGQHQSVELSNE